MGLNWLNPDWPAPNWVHAVSTLRGGGMSRGAYSSLNLADHVGDDPAKVVENRRRLRSELKLPGEPIWLDQRHGNQIVEAESPAKGVNEDASFTRAAGVICVVLTADCLPVLLCDTNNRCVAAVHAGWKGLAAGILETAVQAMESRRLIAWLGPAIGPRVFEVGQEVRRLFIEEEVSLENAFKPTADGKWLMDIYAIARARLNRQGVVRVFGGSWCTHSEADRFFSYRRDGPTGRMATLIWLE